MRLVLLDNHNDYEHNNNNNNIDDNCSNLDPFFKLLFLKRPIFWFNNTNWMVCAPCGWMHFEAYFWNVSNLISETIGLNERVARTLEWMTDHRRRGSRTRYTHTQIHKYKYTYLNTQIHKYSNTKTQIKVTKIQKYSKLQWMTDRRRRGSRTRPQRSACSPQL